MKKATKNVIVRRILIFLIGLNLLGWAAWMFATQAGEPQAKDLGLLIWLIAPLLMAVLLRLFNRDWADSGLGLKLFGNLKWYLASILIFPVILAIVLLAGNLFGGVSINNLNAASFAKAAGTILVFNLIKNTIEELAWRGYLTPKMNAAVKRPIRGHLLVGLFWGAWHIPYYLGLLDAATLENYTALPISTFIPLVVLGMMVAGILFGKLRLITGSVWPVVLMHTVSNVLILTLLLEGFVEVSADKALFFTPSWEGLVGMVIILIFGLAINNERKKEL